jgi:four helix bundle protein
MNTEAAGHIAGDENMQGEIRSYQDLEVWRLGIDLSLRAYRMVAKFPLSERFELSPQIRRCVVSIPANIAEGHARRQPKPYLNHIHIALGSLAEWVTYLVLAERLGFISSEIYDREKREADRLGQMLHALARSLEHRIERVKLGLALGAFALCAGWTAAFLVLR